MALRKLVLVIWSLIVACLNATLILLALCLWLAWSLAARLDDVTGNIAESAGQIGPLRVSIENTATQLAELREDLAGLDPEAAPGVEARLTTQIDQLSTRIDGVQSRLAAFGGPPEEQMDHLIAAMAKTVSEILRRTLTDIQQIF